MLMLAALASAALPGLSVVGARGSERSNATDEANGIDQAVVQDASGKQYDVYAADTEEGRRRLAGRVRAARTMDRSKEAGGLGFSMDRVLAFEPGTEDDSPTGDTAVIVAPYHNGESRSLDMLSIDDCQSVGTAIGAIHRLPSYFLQDEHYPMYTTGQIRSQLTKWIKRLQQAGHIPSEITSSWSRIIDTEGLWSFSTCVVHGGFADGDLLFSGFTVSMVTNWQDMQVNDPARDLAWIFAKSDERHRNALMSAYGRMLGSRLDDLIMLRANLWVQMEQVGEFIQALNRADNEKIMQFKAQVERLAHQLSVLTEKGASAPVGNHQRAQSASQSPSTITVGTLLNESERRRAALEEAVAERAREHDDDTGDTTGETDKTGSSQIAALAEEEAVDSDSTAEHPVQSQGPGLSRAPETGDSSSQVSVHDASTHIYDNIPEHPASATIVIKGAEVAREDADDVIDIDEEGQSGASSPSRTDTDTDPATVLIPLQERQERALRDAQAGLDEQDHFLARLSKIRNAKNAEAAESRGDTDGNEDGTGQSTPKA